jgi:uncharacterized membrane protein
MKNLAITAYAIIAIATLTLTIWINTKTNAFLPAQTDSAYTHEFIHGTVKQVDTNDETRELELKVTANSGPEKGEGIIVNVDPNLNFNEYKADDEILIYKGQNTYEVTDYYHQTGLIVLFILFAIITIIIARKKGLASIASVLGSIALFYFLLLKLIALGISPLLATVLFAFIITILSIPPVHGFNKKSLSSITAICIGYLASFAIVYVFKEIAHLAPATSEDFRTLTIMFPNVDLGDILIASLFLGAVGALIDTAISISSAIFEALSSQPKLSFKKIHKIGMEVGKDILASMTNTLLLAYIASALPFLILLTLSQGSSFTELVNMDFIALELTRIFIGAVSLVILIPIVSSISAYLLAKHNK